MREGFYKMTVMDRERNMQKTNICHWNWSEQQCQPEREGVVIPARLAVPHQVGALFAQSQQALCLRAAQGSVIPPTSKNEDNKEVPFHCQTTETFVLFHVNVMMLKSTYTCLSRGTEGSTLSPRRGGVSPTRRSVVESTDLAVLPALDNRVCSVCAHERSLSAPSNWTETERYRKFYFMPDASEV